MNGYTYIAIFPITDQDRPMSALRAEACLVLDAMAADAGARIIGDPSWTVSGERLVCRAPARPLREDELPAFAAGRRTPEAIIAEIKRLSRIGKGVNEIAGRLGVAAKTVRLYREAA